MMKNIIKWFVMLIHKDMKDFKMDERTDESVKKKIMEKTNAGRIK